MNSPLRLLVRKHLNGTDNTPLLVKAAIPQGGSITIASTVTLEGVDYVVPRAHIMPRTRGTVALGLNADETAVELPLDHAPCRLSCRSTRRRLEGRADSARPMVAATIGL